MNRRGTETGYNYRKANTNEALHGALEDDYNDHVDSLAINIGAIKDIATKMNTHLKKEHDSTDGMLSGFDKASNLMNFTNKKIDEILSSSSGRTSCYLVLAVVFFLFLLYMFG
jgi:hypothetical protein